MLVMPNKHETLAEFVTRIMAEKNLSYRNVTERSGGKISHSTVSEIANGNRFGVRNETLILLAKGLGVSADDMFRVARGLPVGAAGPYEIYAERFDAHDLTETEWQLLETYFNDHVKALKEFKESIRQLHDQPAPGKKGGSLPDEAERRTKPRKKKA